jgi:hypothetical protein
MFHEITNNLKYKHITHQTDYQPTKIVQRFVIIKLNFPLSEDE